MISNIGPKHQHGGQLQKAAKAYNIPLLDWLDLSTGINPNTYPLPTVPENIWQRLPESDDGLDKAASDFYGSDYLLAVAGSQEAIQNLPKIFPKKLQVGIITPAYHSHHQAWEKAGHQLIEVSSNEVDKNINLLDVLIVVNPTNPTAENFSTQTLLNWHQQLQQQNATLIVDEAFMDATPEQSLITKEPKKGLIVLRSIGKFFGLAGIRLGFVWAEAALLKQLAKQQDDWSVSHPARWAGKLALSDNDWKQQQRLQLPQKSQRLVELLEDLVFTKPLITGGVYFNTTNAHVFNTPLFAYFEHPRAKVIHQQLAQQGILTRLFSQPPALRFGLPANETAWQTLAQGLDSLKL